MRIGAGGLASDRGRGLVGLRHGEANVFSAPPSKAGDCLPPMDKIDLLQGTLDMLILRTLQWGPQRR